jgi:hypothetical protein
VPFGDVRKGISAPSRNAPPYSAAERMIALFLSKRAGRERFSGREYAPDSWQDSANGRAMILLGE